MAKKRAQSKAKSNRGGKRPGAGRKPKAIQKLRQDFQQATADIIGPWLPELLGNLKTLADGVMLQKTDADGGVDVFTTPPDREANRYLIDRLVGKPTEKHEHGGDPAAAPIAVTIRRPDRAEAPPTDAGTDPRP